MIDKPEVVFPTHFPYRFSCFTIVDFHLLMMAGCVRPPEEAIPRALHRTAYHAVYHSQNCVVVFCEL